MIHLSHMCAGAHACGARTNRLDWKTEEECKSNAVLRIEQQRLLAQQCTEPVRSTIAFADRDADFHRRVDVGVVNNGSIVKLIKGPRKYTLRFFGSTGELIE